MEILLESFDKIIYKIGKKIYYTDLDCPVVGKLLDAKYQLAYLTTEDEPEPTQWQDLSQDAKTDIIADAHAIYVETTLEYPLLEMGSGFVESVSELVKLLKENGYEFSLKNLLDYYQRHLLIHDKLGIKDSVEVYPSNLGGFVVRYNHTTTIHAHTAGFVLSYLKNNFTCF